MKGKHYTLHIREDDIPSLMWLLAGNNAFTQLHDAIAHQVAEQDKKAD